MTPMATKPCAPRRGHRVLASRFVGVQKGDAGPDKDMVADPGARRDISVRHDAYASAHPSDPLDAGVVAQRAVVASFDHGANDRVVPGLEVVAKVHVPVDDRALAQDRVRADCRRPVFYSRDDGYTDKTSSCTPRRHNSARRKDSRTTRSCCRVHVTWD